MPKEHPILFSGPMVKALLARRKTQTRRLSDVWMKVKAGDRLWVRETWAPFDFSYEDVRPSDLPQYCQIVYRADCKATDDTWRPSIHMPRWASRITLEATADALRERLQDITVDDAIAEGIEKSGDHWKNYLKTSMYPNDWCGARASYMGLWNSLHSKEAPWESNPELTVLSFKVLG